MPLIFEDIQNQAPVQDIVKDGTMQSFKADVIEASKKQLVFAYFSSPQSPAAQQFAPLLEKYVRLAGGKAVMVRFNIEDVQPLAMQLGIKGVPTTMIFSQGALADGFAGVVPDSQLKVLMQALIGKAAVSLDEMLKDAAEKLRDGDASTALNLYADVLEKDPANPNAFAGMIRCFIQTKQFDAAQDLVDGLDSSVRSPELEAAKTALKVALETRDAPAPETLAARVEAEPDNLQARFDYAVALFAAGEQEKALDLLIGIIARKREWNNDAARQQLFRFFTALGNSHPLTVAGRRKLSSLLFS